MKGEGNRSECFKPRVTTTTWKRVETKRVPFLLLLSFSKRGFIVFFHAPDEIREGESSSAIGGNNRRLEHFV